jgi:septation ring formation regulator EzrA
MKKVKKPSLKKGNPLDLSAQHLLTADYKEKSTRLHIEGWTKHLQAIEETLHTFDRMLEETALLRLSEVNKKFSQTKSLLSKTSKELETAQKQQSKAVGEFEESFETPFGEGLFSAQDATSLASTRENIQQVHRIFSESTRALSELAQQCQGFHVHLARLEDAFNTLFLPEQIQEAATQSEALNQRLENIYKTMAGLTVESAQRSPRKMEESFLPLSMAYAREGQWLRQIKDLSRTTSAASALEAITSLSEAATETDQSLPENKAGT